MRMLSFSLLTSNFFPPCLRGLLRDSVAEKFQRGKRDHGFGINIPLLVVEQVAARCGNGFQKCIESRVTAPAQPVLFWQEKLKEALAVSAASAAQPFEVLLTDGGHAA